LLEAIHELLIARFGTEEENILAMQNFKPINPKDIDPRILQLVFTPIKALDQTYDRLYSNPEQNIFLGINDGLKFRISTTLTPEEVSTIKEEGEKFSPENIMIPVKGEDSESTSYVFTNNSGDGEPQYASLTIL
jgi:hypothetical protein